MTRLGAESGASRNEGRDGRTSATTGAVRTRWLAHDGPVSSRRMLDGATVVVVLAVLARWGDPDLVLDVLWVSLAVGAFLYGLRMTVVRIVIVTSLVVAGSAAEEVVYGRPIEIEPLDIAEWPLMIALSSLIALMADRVTSTARHYAGLYRQASDRLITAHEDERASLARDLHDGVGKTLTAAALTLDAAEAAVSAGRDPEAATHAIRHARRLMAGALEEARNVASRLRPARIDELGLGAAIRDLAASAGTEVGVRFPPSVLPPDLLEAQRQIDTYRIVQEAVGNAARHGRATRVWVDAEVAGDAIRIQVTDDGVGFDLSTTPAGLGLVGMRERAAILGARLEVRSQPGAGTSVELRVPILPRRAPADIPVVIDNAVSVLHG